MNVEIDVSGVVLRTERLTLRPWILADLANFHEYASADGVGQPAGWLPHQSIEESLQVLQGFIAEKKTFALELDGKVIGSLGIEEYDEAALPELQNKRGRELGFVIAKDYWVRGLMPEAVTAAIAWLFGEVKLDFVLCGYYIGNDRSRRVQQKCGFVPYKVVHTTTSFGEARDCQLMIRQR